MIFRSRANETLAENYWRFLDEKPAGTANYTYEQFCSLFLPCVLDIDTNPDVRYRDLTNRGEVRTDRPLRDCLLFPVNEELDWILPPRLQQEGTNGKVILQPILKNKLGDAYRFLDEAILQRLIFTDNPADSIVNAVADPPQSDGVAFVTNAPDYRVYNPSYLPDRPFWGNVAWHNYDDDTPPNTWMGRDAFHERPPAMTMDIRTIPIELRDRATRPTLAERRAHGIPDSPPLAPAQPITPPIYAYEPPNAPPLDLDANDGPPVVAPPQPPDPVDPIAPPQPEPAIDPVNPPPVPGVDPVVAPPVVLPPLAPVVQPAPPNVLPQPPLVPQPVPPLPNQIRVGGIANDEGPFPRGTWQTPADYDRCVQLYLGGRLTEMRAIMAAFAAPIVFEPSDPLPVGYCYLNLLPPPLQSKHFTRGDDYLTRDKLDAMWHDIDRDRIVCFENRPATQDAHLSLRKRPQADQILVTCGSLADELRKALEIGPIDHEDYLDMYHSFPKLRRF